MCANCGRMLYVKSAFTRELKVEGFDRSGIFFCGRECLEDWVRWHNISAYKEAIQRFNERRKRLRESVY